MGKVEKYWFLVYSYQAPYQGHLENTVLDFHPFKFVSKNENLRIVFYKEISKKEYEEWINGQFSM